MQEWEKDEMRVSEESIALDHGAFERIFLRSPFAASNFSRDFSASLNFFNRYLARSVKGLRHQVETAGPLREEILASSSSHARTVDSALVIFAELKEIS